LPVVLLKMALTSAEQAANFRKEHVKGLCVCILGGAKFAAPDSEKLVKAMAQELEKSLHASEAVFVTCGMAGVQESFAKNCGDGSRVLHLLREGASTNYGVGKDVHAGADAKEQMDIFAQLGDVYLVVEGGAEVAETAKTAHERGATILPLMRAGGAGAGECGFPSAALEKPSFASEDNWALLKRKEASVDECTSAVVAMVKQLAAKQQAGIWGLLDELITVNRSTLVTALGVVVSILVMVSCGLMYREIQRGEPTLALLHGGFLFLLLGLIASVAWVLSEVFKIEAEKSSSSLEAEAAPKSAEDKKAE